MHGACLCILAADLRCHDHERRSTYDPLAGSSCPRRREPLLAEAELTTVTGTWYGATFRVPVRERAFPFQELGLVSS